MNHMNKLVLILLMFFVSNLSAQGGDQVLMTVGGDKITLKEFESVYKKNPSATATDPKSLEEYLELFINFKLKVREAKSLGMDTTAGFKSELNGYRKQLSQPYLTDTLITDKILKESYDRMQWHIRASHVLIKVALDALPKDTMLAWSKLMKIRDRVVKSKEDFGKVAEQTSEDPYAKGNGGDLGYFTALTGFVYPFETGAYNTAVGEISMPVRTQFGYHIIKVTDKAKHMDLMTAHVMVKLSKSMTHDDSVKAKAKIDEVYQKLKGGADWSEMCKTYSDDIGTKSKAGELPALNMSANFPVEFKSTAMSLAKDGNFSAPFMTRFGWHIVKKVAIKTLAPFADMKNELKTRVAKDMRSNMSRQSLIGKIKTWYVYKEMNANLGELTKYLDTNIFTGKWSAEKTKKLMKPLFTLEGKNYTQADLAAYLESHQVVRPKMDYLQLLNGMMKTWVEETLIAYEEMKLDSKYPRFKSLMEEYRDGILLFDLTDKKVWSKAVKDTAGLRQYYKENKNKFLWDERADVTTYICMDAKTAAAVRKMISKKMTDKAMLEKMNKKVPGTLTIEAKIFMKGENSAVDANWNPGLTKDKTEGSKVSFMSVNKLVAPTPKAFNECKGLVTADYQSHLEKAWLAELKAKYKVEVNKDLLKTIK